MKLLLTLGYLLIFAFAAGFFLWLHLRFWSAYYRIEPTWQELHLATCDDGWRVALHRYRGALDLAEHPVVLCHGVGSSSAALDFEAGHALARYLNGLGFEVWNVDLRGVGDSDRPSWFSERRASILFEDHVDLDVPAILRHILQETGAAKVHWVGHGLGGLVGCAFAQGPGAPLLASITGIGAPGRMRPPAGVRAVVPLAPLLTPIPWLPTRTLARALAPFYVHGLMGDLGFRGDNVDTSTVRHLWTNAAADVPTSLLRQLARWVVVGDCVADGDDRNFTRSMADIEVPLLAIAGDRDVVAPPSTVRYVVEHARAERKAYLNLGGEGAGSDLPAYGHLDLLIGRHAARDVYPRVAGWIAEVAGLDPVVLLQGAAAPQQTAVEPPPRRPAPSPGPATVSVAAPSIPAPPSLDAPKPAPAPIIPPPLFDHAGPDADGFDLDLAAPPLEGYGDATPPPRPPSTPTPAPAPAPPAMTEAFDAPDAPPDDLAPEPPADPTPTVPEPTSEPPAPEWLPPTPAADAPSPSTALDPDVVVAEWEDGLAPAPELRQTPTPPTTRRRVSASMPVVKRARPVTEPAPAPETALAPVAADEDTLAARPAPPRRQSTTGERHRLRRAQDAPGRRTAPPGWTDVVQQVERGASRPERLHRSPVSGDALFDALRLAASRAGVSGPELTDSLLDEARLPTREGLPHKRSRKLAARLPDSPAQEEVAVPGHPSDKLSRRMERSARSRRDQEGE